MARIYEFDAEIKKDPEINGAYIEIPFDVKVEFGKDPGDTIHVTLQENLPKGADAATIDEYIASFDGEIRERMESLRKMIHSCHPDITEKLAW